MEEENFDDCLNYHDTLMNFFCVEIASSNAGMWTRILPSKMNFGTTRTIIYIFFSKHQRIFKFFTFYLSLSIQMESFF